MCSVTAEGQLVCKTEVLRSHSTNSCRSQPPPPPSKKTGGTNGLSESLCCAGAPEKTRQQTKNARYSALTQRRDAGDPLIKTSHHFPVMGVGVCGRKQCWKK